MSAYMFRCRKNTQTAQSSKDFQAYACCMGDSRPTLLRDVRDCGSTLQRKPKQCWTASKLCLASQRSTVRKRKLDEKLDRALDRAVETGICSAHESSELVLRLLCKLTLKPLFCSFGLVVCAGHCLHIAVCACNTVKLLLNCKIDPVKRSQGRCWWKLSLSLRSL